MVYGATQKAATYKYRIKMRAIAAFKEKVSRYNATAYAALMSDPEKLAKRYAATNLKRYYTTDCLRDIRRLFEWMC